MTFWGTMFYLSTYSKHSLPFDSFLCRNIYAMLMTDGKYIVNAKFFLVFNVLRICAVDIRNFIYLDIPVAFVTVSLFW